MVKRSSYRLGRRLKSSRRARLDYIVYLQSGGDPRFGGMSPEERGRLGADFGCGGAMRARFSVYTRQELAAPIALGGDMGVHVAKLQTLSFAAGLGGNFRMNIFPPVTIVAAWDLGGSMMTHVHIIKRLTASFGLEGAMRARIPPGRLLRAGFGLGGEMAADIAEPVGVVLQAQFGLGGAFAADITIPTDADADAIIAAMSVAPDATRQTLINNTVVALKNAGLWAKLDILYMFAAHTEQAARIDWKHPATRSATRLNVATFNTDQGFKGDGSIMYLNLNWALADAVAGSRVGTTWNFHLGVKAFDHPGTSTALLGEIDTDGISQSLTPYHPSFSGGLLGGVGYTGGAPIFNYANADANNHAVVSVNGTTKGVGRSYQNGVFKGTPTANNTGTLASSNSIDNLLALRNAAVHSPSGIQFVHAGAALTDTEVSDIYTILSAYLSGL